MTSIQAAWECVDIPARPCIAFVGAHTSGLELAERLIDDLPCWLHGVYLQVNHLHPLDDSVAKIVTICRLLLRVRQRGFIAIGGRLGSPGILVRALGVDAVDAGLGEGKSFSLADKVVYRRNERQAKVRLWLEHRHHPLPRQGTQPSLPGPGGARGVERSTRDASRPSTEQLGNHPLEPPSGEPRVEVGRPTAAAGALRGQPTDCAWPTTWHHR
jgi:hypothetical protein